MAATAAIAAAMMAAAAVADTVATGGAYVARHYSTPHLVAYDIDICNIEP
jgi:hypothetical protein